MLRSILFSLLLDLGSTFNRCFLRFCVHLGWIWVQNLFHFGCILRPVWDHFGSGLGPFWLHLGSILHPFGVYGRVLWRKSFRVGPRAAAGEEPLPILSDFGRKRRPQGVPKWSQNGTKILEKSMQKSMLNSAWFFMALGAFLGDFGGVFGTLDP